MNQWTPDEINSVLLQVIALVGALVTLIGAITAGIVAIIQALKSRGEAKEAKNHAEVATSRVDTLEKRIDAHAAAVQQTQNQLFQVAKDAAPPTSVSVTPVTIEQPDQDKI